MVILCPPLLDHLIEQCIRACKWEGRHGDDHHARSSIGALGIHGRLDHDVRVLAKLLLEDGDHFGQQLGQARGGVDDIAQKFGISQWDAELAARVGIHADHWPSSYRRCMALGHMNTVALDTIGVDGTDRRAGRQFC